MARAATRLLALLLAGAPPLVAQIELSENPVRGDQVTISWPAGSGSGLANVLVYGFTGQRLHQTTVAASASQYVWDLTIRGGTRRVVNGAYIIVVEVNQHRYRRRLFVARPNPSP